MGKLRIVIDGRMYQESGIGRYTRNLVDQLQIIDRENYYLILLLKSDYESLVFSNNFHKVLADFRWYGVNEQVKLLKLLKLLKPDLAHFPHFNAPVFYKGKFVVTIHDLIHQHFSMERTSTHGPIIYKIKQAGYKIVFKNAVCKSTKILVPSGYVKSLLGSEWGVSADKVVVTSEAVDERIISLAPRMLKNNIKKPYIFYVGNAHPHKNIKGLVRVFRELREKYPNLSLVLSGNDHYFWQKVKEEFQDEGIIYTGYVSDDKLASLYKNAKCFVMPSLEEGFGIPILEAMACSCPVVSSNKGSLPEVGGEAALYFDPEEDKDMVKKVSQVLDNKDLREQLIIKGLKRIKLFSWRKLAEKTLEVYRACM